MPSSEPQAQALRRGVGLGFLLAFVVVFGASLALGADVWVAVIAGAFLGLFVGGGLGLLLAGRIASEPE